MARTEPPTEESENGRGRDGGMPGRTGGTSAGSGPVAGEGELRMSGPEKGPQNLTLADERMREDVTLALSEAELDASRIEVRVTNGEVTLEGTVVDAAARRTATSVATETPGVKRCHDLLRVD